MRCFPRHLFNTSHQILEELLPDVGVNLPRPYKSLVMSLAFEVLNLGDASLKSFAPGIRLTHLRMLSLALYRAGGGLLYPLSRLLCAH